jgi:hypothetical protein
MSFQKNRTNRIFKMENQLKEEGEISLLNFIPIIEAGS